MHRLTETFVGNTPVPPTKNGGKPSQIFYRDILLPGFGLRVTSGGTKSFIVEKRINGKVKRITIGRFGPFTVAKARRQASGLLEDIEAGIDPFERAKIARILELTLAEIFEDYLKSHKHLKPGAIKNYRHCMDTIFRDWQDRKLAYINKDMVVIRHRMRGKNSPSRANNAMRVLRAIFNYARAKYKDSNGEPVFGANPVDTLSQNRAWHTVEHRQTLIRTDQLKDWFDATLLLANETTRDYLHFLLFTGLRRSEASRLQWSDVDFKNRTFTIRATNKHSIRTLPLSGFLQELLSRRFEHREALSPWVFASHTKRGYLVEPRTAVTRVSEKSGVPFTLHDLRRTFVKIAGNQGIPDSTQKRLLNRNARQKVHDTEFETLREPMEQISRFILNAIRRGQQPGQDELNLE